MVMTWKFGLAPFQSNLNLTRQQAIIWLQRQDLSNGGKGAPFG